MRRLQYDRHGGPEEMYVGRHELRPLRAGEVRVAVHAAAINPLDWRLRQGELRVLTGFRFPKAMGTDFAGLVEAVGEGVADVAVGDPVFGSADFRKSGAFAEALVVKRRFVAPKPERLSFAEAACLPIPAMTAFAAMAARGRGGPPRRVFVHGCSGAVGSFAAGLARASGAEVAGACGPGSVDKARMAGVGPVLRYEDVRTGAATGTYDLVFDTVGTLDVGLGVSMLASGGVMADINPTPGRVLRGFVSRRYRLVFATMGVGHLSDIGQAADKGVFQPVIAREVPFDDAVAAIADAQGGASRAGRIVLVR